MRSNDIDFIESTIKDFIAEISTLESQKREEETVLERHAQTKADINMQNELLNTHANNINETNRSLNEKKRKFDFLKKSEHVCISVAKIIIPVGTILSVIIGFLNGLPSFMVVFMMSYALGIASISLSQSIFHKYKKLKSEMMGIEESLEGHKELLRESAKTKKHLISKLLSKEKEKLSQMNLASIEENIHYYEAQIKQLLMGVPSNLDTEYLSEVRESYFGEDAVKAVVPRYTPNN